ncbi:hypothetical protein LU276_02760 [Moraxella haemolytica]|uniref:hypothetical protein n=1 Tax=Moraxella haemolytica TaxID=2904119 RepID=UPI0025432AD0|nr:hypothetical protein [Moraxella sp. ZY171148]WII95771.1 hypothetical protein LU276_02760 [Moraxella sp. ZY171148]
MGLLDITLNPLKDYISLPDLLLLIGENTQNPLYDICLYLQSVKFGEAVTPYKINQDFALYECKDFIKNMDGLNAVSSIIDDIANNLKQDESDRKLVVQSLMGLNEICGWQEHIKRYFYQEWQKEYYFKRQDLLAFEPLAECLEPNFAMQEEYREIARLRKQLQQVLDGRYLSSLISQNDRLKKENETLQAKLQPNINRYGTLSEQLEQQAQTETISKLQNRIAELESQLASQSENGTPAIVELPHTNAALAALFDAMNTHWQNPKQPPKQAFIKNWILDNYPSLDPSKALWIDKIIRHQDV